MSNPLYTNFKLIHDDLQTMANRHKQINSFGLGDTDQLSYWTQIRDHEENPTFEPPVFPLLYVIPGNCINNLQYKTWEMTLVMSDIVDRDLTNQVDVLSDTFQMLQDVVSQYRLSVLPIYGCYDTFYDAVGNFEASPFMEEYSDLTNGWSGVLRFTTTVPLDRCAAAYLPFTGTPIIHEEVNFKTLHDDFRLLADHHKQLNSFGFGQFEDLSYWTESRLKQNNPTYESPFFPLLYVIPNTATQMMEQNGSSYTEFEFNCIVMDIIDRDLTNQVDVLSDTNQILDDIVGQFRLAVTNSLGCFNAKYYLDDEVVYYPFLEKYSDLCGGWNAVIKIKVMTPLDRCAAAFNSFLSPTPTATPTATPGLPSPTATPSSTPTPTPSATPPPFNPLNIGDLQHWYLSTSGATPAVWTNLGINGGALLQANPAFQPTIITDTLGSYTGTAVNYFANQNQGGGFGTQNYSNATIFVVMKLNAFDSGNQNWTMNMSDAGVCFIITTNQPGIVKNPDVVVPTLNPYPVGELLMAASGQSGSFLSVSFNDVLGVPIFPFTGGDLGSFFNIGSVGTNVDNDTSIFELLIYDKVLTPSEYADVMSYLKTKYQYNTW